MAVPVEPLPAAAEPLRVAPLTSFDGVDLPELVLTALADEVTVLEALIFMNCCTKLSSESDETKLCEENERQDGEL